MATLADRLFSLAADGDTAAARLALEYTLGKPAPAVDPDRVDLDEVELLMSARQVMVAFSIMSDRMPPEQLANVVRMLAHSRLAAYRNDATLTDADFVAKFLAAALDGGEKPPTES
jgi:hypothetical protein